VLAAAIGCLTGVIAFALYDLIGLFTNISFYRTWSFHFRSPQHTPLGAWMILIPVVGGLLIGLMARYGSEKIRGHGIPEAMEAVLISRSRIEAKVAILKPLSAAIGIGTGGPFGAEGPIIQTGGAFGSLVGQFFSTTAAERKVMLACGGGAGLAATFNAPITGVLLGLELLLFEFRARSFIPLIIASAMAVGIRRLLFGTGPMFLAGAPDYNFFPNLPYYVVLGLLCGLAAVGFSLALEKLENFFDGLKRVPRFLHPAIGALGLGIVGFFLPRVLGSGYDTIDDILNARLALGLVFLILILKAFVVLLSLGSGTSGGTLAPMFMISAALGSVRDHRQCDLSQRPSFARGFCGGRDGRAARSCGARYVHVHVLRLRDHARLPGAASGDGRLHSGGCGRLLHDAGLDHDSEVPQARHGRSR